MLTVYAVLPTGNGRLQWSPAGKPIVSWDFEVEID
jgi:predicted lipoprotein with Yx(FWY)xxD motif